MRARQYGKPYLWFESIFLRQPVSRQTRAVAPPDLWRRSGGPGGRDPWGEPARTQVRSGARISLRGRRLRVVKPIAPGVRQPDFRETAKGPEGDASAIIVRSADRFKSE